MNASPARVLLTALLTMGAGALAGLPGQAAATSADAFGQGDLRIHDVQGSAHLSPMRGALVDVPGVVTTVAPRGFWIEDPEPDADPATSEGLYVYTGSRPTVQVADSVQIAGRVTEYRPGGSATTNLTTTEITSPTVTVLASDVPLPEPSLIGSGGRVPPSSVIDDDATGSVETSGSFDATTDGIDFWESMEGMRIRIDDAEVVGPTNRYGELPVVPAGSGLRTARGGIVVQPDDFNPERLLLDDAFVAMPDADVGDTIPGPTVGVLDYTFANFKLLVTRTPVVASGSLARETADAARPGELAVATFNVENLDAADPQAKFDALAATIVSNLAAPDVLALEEVQDNDGPVNSPVVAADQTLDRLVGSIVAAGGPAYEWRQIDPVDDQDGGEPGGNIRVAFLYRTDRGLTFVDRSGGTATSATSVTARAGGAALTYSPGRVAPGDDAWIDSRKPLAGEFRWKGRPLFVVANHFASKSGDDPLFGRYQPPIRSSEVQRHQQAGVVRGFVDDILAVDPTAQVVVAGDLNDFHFSETADILVGSGVTSLVDLPRILPRAERYTYVYEGNAQVLDHILVSLSLATWDYDVVHVNAEFADQVSDHDPQVVYLR